MLGLTQLPQLVAEGVILRPFLDSDQDLVLEVATDPYIPTITTVPATADPATAAAFIHRQHARLIDGAGFSFAIADAGTDEPLGQMGLWPISDSGRASIGYWIAARHRGRGLAAAALRVVSAGALDTLPTIDRLELYVEPGNAASWHTAEAAGFLREGLLRSWKRVGQQRRDMFMYSRLRL